VVNGEVLAVSRDFDRRQVKTAVGAIERLWSTTHNTHRSEIRLASFPTVASFTSSINLSLHPPPGPSLTSSIIPGHRVRLSNASVMSKHRSLRWDAFGPVQSPPTISGGSELCTDGYPEIYKRVEVHSLVSSAAVQPTQFFSPTSQTSGLVPLLSVLPHDTPYHHVLQSCSHLPRHRGSLRQRHDRSGRPLPCS